jgi:uncharacterized membrane protein
MVNFFFDFKKVPWRDVTIWINSFGKSIEWFTMTLFFGLLEIWLILPLNHFSTAYDFRFERIIIDGSFLFFSTAVVASITIDNLLSQKRTWRKEEIYGFLLFPGFIIFVCVVLFLILKLGKDINTSLVTSVELTIFMMTFIYTVAVKFSQFRADITKGLDK